MPEGVRGCELNAHANPIAADATTSTVVSKEGMHLRYQKRTRRMPPTCPVRHQAGMYTVSGGKAESPKSGR